MKELALALEKTNKAVVSRRGELETEVVETQAAQTQLDKAAEDFRWGLVFMLSGSVFCFTNLKGWVAPTLSQAYRARGVHLLAHYVILHTKLNDWL